MKLKKILKKIRSWERPISTVLGVAVVVVAGILIFNFFKSQEGSLKEELVISEPEIIEGGQLEKIGKLPVIHTVNTGESLWLIAEKYYGSGYNWVDIAKENELSRPDYVTVGEKLVIPAVSVRQPQKESGKLASGNKIADVSKYTVVKGDNLWEIAVAVYGDGYQWVKIYQANYEKIGSNPGLIFAGTALSLP